MKRVLILALGAVLAAAGAASAREPGAPGGSRPIGHPGGHPGYVGGGGYVGPGPAHAYGFGQGHGGSVVQRRVSSGGTWYGQGYSQGYDDAVILGGPAYGYGPGPGAVVRTIPAPPRPAGPFGYPVYGFGRGYPVGYRGGAAVAPPPPPPPPAVVEDRGYVYEDRGGRYGYSETRREVTGGVIEESYGSADARVYRDPAPEVYRETASCNCDDGGRYADGSRYSSYSYSSETRSGSPVYVSAPPVYVSSPPVRVASPPVYVSGPPVYVDAPTVYVEPPRVHVTPSEVHVRPSPVEMLPAETYAPPVEGPPPPAYDTSVPYEAPAPAWADAAPVQPPVMPAENPGPPVDDGAAPYEAPMTPNEYYGIGQPARTPPPPPPPPSPTERGYYQEPGERG